MKTRRNSYLWMLVGVGAGLAVLPVTILFVFVLIPALQPDTAAPAFVPDQEAADSEGVNMLHTARAAVQDAYARTGEAPLKLTGAFDDGGAGLDPEDLKGAHYVLINGVGVLEDGRMQVVIVPLVGDYALMRMPFRPDHSSGEIIVENHPDYDEYTTSE